MQTKPDSAVDSLLTRPDDQRLREFKYRFSQTIVFGLPVLGLERWGYTLGPADADRWVPILQALLCGWIVYVAAAGMFFEGLILLKQKITTDFVVAIIAIALYIFSLISVLHILGTARLWYRPLQFHAVVLTLAGWTGLQWFRWSRKMRA